MGGLYIPDVNLPGDGDFELWIEIKKDGSFTYFISGKWRDGEQKVIPIPSHGRLIDADEMKESIRKQTAFLRLIGEEFAEIAETLEKGFLQEIDNTPTIIPSELMKEET